MRLLCFSSFRGKRGQFLSLSLCHCRRLPHHSSSRSSSSLAPSLSPSLVTSAPGIPRLRRHERQRRKSERASWAAKRRGVVNDSSEPHSAFLPSRSLSLSLSLSLSPYSVVAWERARARVSRPQSLGKSHVRSLVCLSLDSVVWRMQPFDRHSEHLRSPKRFERSPRYTRGARETCLLQGIRDSP